ncbi:hypothetical protein ACFL56_02155 [Candidatus Margulisiibacteriota bacterium]
MKNIFTDLNKKKLGVIIGMLGLLFIIAGCATTGKEIGSSLTKSYYDTYNVQPPENVTFLNNTYGLWVVKYPKADDMDTGDYTLMGYHVTDPGVTLTFYLDDGTLLGQAKSDSNGYLTYIINDWGSIIGSGRSAIMLLQTETITVKASIPNKNASIEKTVQLKFELIL